MIRILLFLRQLSWTSTLSAVSAALSVLVAFISSLSTTTPASTATQSGPALLVVVSLGLTSISLAILSGRE